MPTTDTAEATTETDDTPAVDDRDPSTLIPAAVDEILELAMTWLAWDGTPVLGDGNAWTPLKALRRITDHLLDHLAEIEATLAGQPTVPDSWLGRAVTLESDWARFTEADLNEASNRLSRYAELYRVRLAGLTAAELDRPRPSAWTVRQIAHHVAGVTYYAHQLGDLTVRKPDRGTGPGGPARRHSVLLSERAGDRAVVSAGHVRRLLGIFCCYHARRGPAPISAGRHVWDEALLAVILRGRCLREDDGSLYTPGCIQRSIVLVIATAPRAAGAECGRLGARVRRAGNAKASSGSRRGRERRAESREGRCGRGVARGALLEGRCSRGVARGALLEGRCSRGVAGGALRDGSG
jgi:hypothetical protein